MIATGFKKEFDSKLANIKMGKEMGLYVFEPVFESVQAGKSKHDDEEVIMLTSNNYLGLASHEEIKKAMKDAIDIYGSGTCGARLHNGTTRLHRELEERCAEFFRTEDAVIVSAGYLANVAGITALADSEDSLIITDQLTMVFR